jgi:putative tricarboxylic transport membrane protein
MIWEQEGLREKYPAIFLLLFSIYVCSESAQLGLGAIHKPGSGFISFWSGIFLGVVALILLIQNIRVAKGNKAQEAKEKTNWKAGTIILVSLFGYILFLQHLGFIITTILFVLVLLKWIEKKGWALSILTSLILAFACYYVFRILLHAELPKGLFYF